jgi:hypothetical protein
MKEEENNNQVTIIVTGTVRSGTSVMTRTLYEGGINVLFDDKAKPADASNPNGYFEYPRVMSLRKYNPKSIRGEKENFSRFPQHFPQHFQKINTAWLDEAKGGAVKILPNNLLEGLPLDRKYAVIFMKRDFSEVAESYRSYLNNRPNNRPNSVKLKEILLTKEQFIEKWSQIFSKNAREAIDYLKNNPYNFSIIEVEMHKLNEQIGDVSAFVNEHLKTNVQLVVPPR